MKVLLFLLLSAICAQAKVAPDFFPTCDRNDPEIEKCIKNAMNTMRPQLIAGVPEVDIPPLDPFILPTLNLDRESPTVTVKATVTNLIAHGARSFVVDRFKLNLNNKNTGELKFRIPWMTLTADYELRGSKILTFNISAGGKFTGNFSGIAVIAKGTAKPVTQDGMEYLQIDKFLIKVRINDAQITLLDNQESAIASTMAAAGIFNASPQLLLEILNPVINEVAGGIIKSIANKVLWQIPI